MVQCRACEGEGHIGGGLFSSGDVCLACEGRGKTSRVQDTCLKCKGDMGSRGRFAAPNMLMFTWVMSDVQ